MGVTEVATNNVNEKSGDVSDSDAFGGFLLPLNFDTKKVRSKKPPQSAVHRVAATN